MRLIGINGLKTSGKDTTFKTVASLMPDERVERRAFADKLKIMAALAIGFTGPDEHLIREMDKFKEDGRIEIPYETNASFSGLPMPGKRTITGRQYLQWFGAHARDVFGKSFWVDQVVPIDPNAFTDIWATVGRTGPWVGVPELGCITDVRYPNEAERVLTLDGVVWEVQRPGLESDGHSSEEPLPRELVTRVIDNSGDLAHLEREVAAALAEL